MPPLFAFAAGAENKLVHSMHERASQAEHSKQMAEWSQQRELHEHKQQLQRMSTQKILAQPGMRGEAMTTSTEANAVVDEENERVIAAKFRESVLESGIRVVDYLGPQHKVANYFQENPFKLLAAVGVPTVYFIFKGREGQKHLQMQSMLMHTRVFGQFAVITMLLSLMGFKEYMDRSGRFVTETDVQSRIMQMQQSRQELMMRLQIGRMEAEKVVEKRRKAHDEDMKKSVKKATKKIQPSEVDSIVQDA